MTPWRSKRRRDPLCRAGRRASTYGRHVGYEIDRWHDVGGYACDLAPLGSGAPAELTAIGDVPAEAVTHALATRPRSSRP